MFLPFTSVLDYGAKGDGVTDDTPFIQAAINAAPPYGVLLFPYPAVNYRLSAVLQIAKPLTAYGFSSALRQQNASLGVFNVSASDVTLRRLVMEGQQHTTMIGTSRAVNVAGSSAAAPITAFAMVECQIAEFGYSACSLQYVNGFNLSKTKINNIQYGGILGLSVNNGTIDNNSIDSIVNAGNAYGISITRNSAAVNELVSDPLSINVLITRNTVSNVAHWTAIDTHAGQAIAILGNRVANCYRGIAVGDCPNKADISSYGPKDCQVMGNILDSGVTDGSADAGISVNGAGTTLGTIIDGGDGCVVAANTVRGFGYQANPLGKAILFQFTRGATCKGNTIIEPGVTGILWYHTNYGFCCVGNPIRDPWSNAQTARAISCASDYNKGVIDGNSFFKATRSATSVLQLGVNIGSYPNNKVDLGTNYSEAPMLVANERLLHKCEP